MTNEEILNREQLVRIVTPVGNGAHIFAPKRWIGEKVIIVRTPALSLKEKVLRILEPHMENILGVYLYGSYARNEQRQDSDIDLLIISNKKFKIKEKGFEIIILEKDKIIKSIRLAPILVYSALLEAKPIINLRLLDDLKKNYKPKPRNFRGYIEETKNIIKINEEIPDPYSIILRLRGIYLIEGVLSGQIYSYDGFKKWVLEEIHNKDKKVNFDDVYSAYLKIKKGLKAHPKESDLKDILLILNNKVQKLEKRIYG